MMIAFVGYVNTLVVEDGILRKLHRAILTQNEIRCADQELIDRIAPEDSRELDQQKQNKIALNILQNVLNVLDKSFHSN